MLQTGEETAGQRRDAGQARRCGVEVGFQPTLGRGRGARLMLLGSGSIAYRLDKPGEARGPTGVVEYPAQAEDHKPDQGNSKDDNRPAQRPDDP